MAKLPDPPKGIVRLKYKTTTDGWNARYTRDGVTFSQLFSDSKYDSPIAALEAAIEWRHQAEELLPRMNRKEYAELKKRNNSSGHTGVYKSVGGYYKGKALYYWYAIWSPQRGEKASKSFSVQKFGDDEAKRLAIAAREEAIANLPKEWPEDSWGSRRDARIAAEMEVAFSKDIFAFEGDEKYIIHRTKERSPDLRQQKVDAFLAEHGDLFCEICHFSFEEQYGVIGRGLIEVHHLVPLAEMTASRKTTLDELMCVCSNCHLVLHNGDPTENLNRMQFVFSARKTSAKRKRTKRSTRMEDESGL